MAVERFNLAWFYLLAHGGLRVSEATNVRLSDCDIRLQRLRVRSDKGNRDRVIPMTATLTTVLQNYLMVRESAKSDHLLIKTVRKPHLLQQTTCCGIAWLD